VDRLDGPRASLGTLTAVTSRRWACAAVAALLVLATAACSGSPDAPAEADPGSPPTYRTYVSMGDSFTGAPGVPVTETTTGCARSDSNYPAILAAELDVDLTDVSCGAATTEAMTRPQQTPLGEVPPQLDALTPDTDLVTIGIGVNDHDLFATLFSSCVAVTPLDPGGSPCRDALATDGGDVLTDALADTEAAVTATLAAIRERSPDATVVLVGYPQVVPAEGTCDALPLAAGDYDFARDVWDALDAALVRAAEAEDATFVDMRAASEGRDICSGDDAWVNGAVNDPKRASSFHPFVEEQQAVAELVAQALRA
jgi:lysophospholipase L1-like esterase